MARKAAFMVSCLAVALILLGVSWPARAGTTTIQPNEYWVDGVFDDFYAGSVYEVSYTWSSDVPLTLSISNEAGLIESFYSEKSGSGTVRADGGSVFFTWLNSGSVEANLIYQFSTTTMSEHEMMTFSWWIIGGIIAVVVVLVIVALVIVIALGEKKPREMTYPPSSQVYAPVVGACPSCGNPYDSVTRFCSKCGARIR